MLPEDVKNAIEQYKDKALAWKLAGAGGGGYLALISEQPVPNAIRIKIRRKL
jgi:galactokinase/mevalonate kinase-like predicted kinase